MNDIQKELEQLKHERDALATAIRDAAVKAGIASADACLTGPHMLMLCDDMAEVIVANTTQPADQLYRVAEFWSSSTPGTKVLMLAQGDNITEWAKRADFIRWVDAPSQGAMPEGFDREDVEAVVDSLLEDHPKTVNVGGDSGMGDVHIESSTAYAARFILAVIGQEGGAA